MRLEALHAQGTYHHCNQAQSKWEAELAHTNVCLSDKLSKDPDVCNLAVDVYASCYEGRAVWKKVQ